MSFQPIHRSPVQAKALETSLASGSLFPEKRFIYTKLGAHPQIPFTAIIFKGIQTLICIDPSIYRSGYRENIEFSYGQLEVGCKESVVIWRGGGTYLPANTLETSGAVPHSFSSSFTSLDTAADFCMAPRVLMLPPGFLG